MPWPNRRSWRAKSASASAKLAEKQHATGKHERAEATQARAEEVAPAEVVTPETPKVEGVAYRTTWTAEVYDLPALVKSVAAGQHGHELLEPNMRVLHVLARAQKEEFSIPGVRAVSEQGMRPGMIMCECGHFFYDHTVPGATVPSAAARSLRGSHEIV